MKNDGTQPVLVGGVAGSSPKEITDLKDKSVLFNVDVRRAKSSRFGQSFREDEATNLSKDLEDFTLIKVKNASNENQDIVLTKVLTTSPMECGSASQT
ncbi:hypothetical protein JHK87_033890 [Glycine soja]|nr:hypothetical protein JHK87_033890 [Glycine soja]